MFNLCVILFAALVSLGLFLVGAEVLGLILFAGVFLAINDLMGGGR